MNTKNLQRLSRLTVDTSKSLLAHIIFYLAGLCFGLIFFFFLLQSPLFTEDVILFYRGLQLIAVVMFAQFIFMLVLNRWFHLIETQAHALSATLVTSAFLTTFLITIPVTLERSVTIFLLASMYNANKPIPQSELQALMIQQYVIEYAAVGRRMKEQERTGNVSCGLDFDCELTQQGKVFVVSSRLTAKLLGLDTRFVEAQKP